MAFGGPPVVGQPRLLPAPGGVVRIHPNGRKQYSKTGDPFGVRNVGAPGRLGVNLGPVPRAPRAPAAPAAQAPAAPAAGGAPAAQNTLGEGGNPLTLDSTYYAQAQQNLFNENQGLAANDAQATQYAQARDTALQNLAAQQPKDEQATTQTANKQGLFYSGALGQRLGDLATTYAQRRAAATDQYANQERARLAAREAIQAGYGVNDAALIAAAADRQIGRDTAAANAGGLVANDPAPAPSAAPAPAARVARRPQIRINRFTSYAQRGRR